MDVLADLRVAIRPGRADFNATLVPTIDPARILGVPMPDLRKIAKNLVRSGEAESFLEQLPHPYLEMDILHMLCLNEERDPAQWEHKLRAFLPYVDNWMVTDAISPVLLKLQPQFVLQVARTLVRDAGHDDVGRFDDEATAHAGSGRDAREASGVEYPRAARPYDVRTGVVLLLIAMQKGSLADEDISLVSAQDGSHYYVAMVCAWYLATAFEYAPERIKDLVEGSTLDREIYKLTIRKILESRKTREEDRAYFREVRKKARR